jgi:ABC-type branched-subunit amino acid transport system ATPase component
MAATKARLAVEGLTVIFGGLRAVDNVSFEAGRGEILSIVGPNGAGKSTLVQTITGFVRPSQGSVLLDGTPLDGLSPDGVAALGVARTFQTSRVFPALTVVDSVLVGTQRRLIGGGRDATIFGGFAEPLAALVGLPRYRKRQAECAEKAEAVMRLFGERLWPRRDQPAHSLSYANRRRLEIARALVAEPDLLLLDEPTAGMNPTESHELADVLVALRERFPVMTIVLIEHKLDIVRRLAKRTIVMGQGRVLVDDEPEAAFANPEVAAAYLGRGGGTVRATAAVSGPMTLDMAGANHSVPAITFDAVDVFYGPVQALFKVSLEVRQGEAVAVLGGNASGKSTTIKTVLGLVRPTQGKVHLFGKETAGLTTTAIIASGLASIPEGRRMFAELTVRDNLLMGAYPRRHAGATILSDLERVLDEFPWLKERLGQLAGTLSGGEQQMVAMGRAWLRKPRLLCIDEPSMGLSPAMVDRVYEILARWKAQGLTILMVEQSANRALELVDRAYVLKNGVVDLAGDARTLAANPAVRQAYLGGGAMTATPHHDDIQFMPRLRG